MKNKEQKKSLWRRWLEDVQALAGIEFGLLLPIFVSLMMAVYDLGNAMIAAQKVVTASQVVADLVTRKSSVTRQEIEEAIIAGELSIRPYDTDSYGVDVAAVKFDDVGNPNVYWRETRNMSPVDTGINNSKTLGRPGEGVLVVTVRYDYLPFFAGFVTDKVELQEIFILHGRRSSVIECPNCAV